CVRRSCHGLRLGAVDSVTTQQFVKLTLAVVVPAFVDEQLAVLADHVHLACPAVDIVHSGGDSATAFAADDFLGRRMRQTAFPCVQEAEPLRHGQIVHVLHELFQVDASNFYIVFHVASVVGADGSLHKQKCVVNKNVEFIFWMCIIGAWTSSGKR